MQYTTTGRIMDGTRMLQIAENVADQIMAEFDCDPEQVRIIGIQRQGVPFARLLADKIREKCGKELPVGTLDISMYRDDIGMRKTLPTIYETEIPFALSDKILILADDVLQAGRTIRAALDAITNFGRPSIIRLAVLLDRGQHEFPIAADYTGEKIDTSRGFRIHVCWKTTDGEDAVYLEKR